MSIKLFYQPAVESVDVEGATDDVVTTLRDAFGSVPFFLGKEHLPTLKALAAAAGNLDPNPYEIIIEGIVACGKIRLYFRFQPEEGRS